MFTSINIKKTVLAILPILFLLFFHDPAYVAAKVTFPTIGAINSPQSGKTIQGISTISGWFLDNSKVAKVEVYVDGHYRGKAKYGILRNDVYYANRKYKNRYSGFQYRLDTRTLRTGRHKLTVKETSKSGRKAYRSQTVVVRNLPALGTIDFPKNNATLQNVSTVSGWFLNGSGVSRIDVFLDGHYLSRANYGYTRNDVNQKYTKYGNRNSGFRYTLETRKLRSGRHSLTVREKAANGETLTKSIIIYVHNLPAKGSIESPTSNSTVKGRTNVQGWFLNGSGVTKVETFIDNHYIGKTNYGLLRTDLKKAFPQYGNDHSGYQFNLNTYSLTNGAHTLMLKETGGNGETSTLSRKIIVNNISSYIQIDLKKPANLTAQDIRNFFNKSQSTSTSPLKQYADDFINAQKKYGVNAQYLLAHAIWETGWGRSNLAVFKKNLYGYGAYDVAPFTSAYYFPYGIDSIGYAASKIRSNYLNANGSYYNKTYGPTLQGMNVSYASDQNWKYGIAALMAKIKPLNSEYYSRVAEMASPTVNNNSYGRDIPAGKPFPASILFNFPSGIKAIANPSVNLRSIPYLSTSTQIGTVPPGTEVDLYGYNQDVRYDPKGSDSYVYHWYRVRANGQNGWLYGKYLTIENLLQVKVTNGNATIYSNPSTTSKVLSSAANSTYLRAYMSNNQLALQNGWYKVYLPNSQQLGWVNNKSVTKIVH